MGLGSWKDFAENCRRCSLKLINFLQEKKVLWYLVINVFLSEGILTRKLSLRFGCFWLLKYRLEMCQCARIVVNSYLVRDFPELI